MRHLTILLLGYLAATLTGSLLLAGFMLVQGISQRLSPWELLIMVFLISFCVSIVVFIAWLTVATPYYFICIRTRITDSRSLHLTAASLLAILFVAVLSYPNISRSIHDIGDWVAACSIPIASAIAGTLTLLTYRDHRHAPTDITMPAIGGKSRSHSTNPPTP